MTFKKLAAVFMAALTAFLLCGCDIFTVDTDTLLSPPKLSGDMLPISEAIEESVSEAYTLKYPTNGDHRSAVILEDIDGDSKFEAIAFYSTKSDEQITMHICVIKQTDKDDWKFISEQSIIAGGVDRIVFADLDGNGGKEIIVGWEIYGNSEKQLAVYSLSDIALSQRMLERYSGFVCCDLDEDEKQEIFINYLDTAESTHLAKLFSVERDGVSQIAGCMLDGAVKTVNDPIFSELSNGKPAIYLDGIKGVGAITEVLFMSKGELINPLLSGEMAYENTATIRTASLFAKDINGDGTLEIPISDALPSADAGGENAYYTNWCSYNGEKLTTKLVTVMNTVDGYYITPPPSWVGNIAISRNLDAHERSLYSFDGSTNTVGELLARFKAVEKSKYKPKDYDGWCELAKNDDTVFIGYILTAAGTRSIDENELKAIFILE